MSANSEFSLGGVRLYPFSKIRLPNSGQTRLLILIDKGTFDPYNGDWSIGICHHIPPRGESKLNFLIGADYRIKLRHITVNQNLYRSGAHRYRRV